MGDRASLARTSKGKRPQYFSDPATDKLLAIVMSLAGELSVTRERLDTIERLIEKHQLFDRVDIEAFRADGDALAERREWREKFLQRVLHVVRMELEQSASKDALHSDEDTAKYLP